MRIAIALGVVALSVLASCGQDGTASRRDAARTYVEAVRDRDWDAACAVSVQGEQQGCVRLLRGVYEGPPPAPAPTVDQAERTVERRGARYLVHLEVQIIR